MQCITCGILALALYRIHKAMLEYEKIGMSMTKLVVHLGSFALFLLACMFIFSLRVYELIDANP